MTMNPCYPSNLWPKGGIGKSTTSVLLARELVRPKGPWREYWTKHVRAISANNRLPRGFREPKPLLTIESPIEVRREPLVRHPNDTGLTEVGIREAIQKMKPANPAK